MFRCVFLAFLCFDPRRSCKEYWRALLWESARATAWTSARIDCCTGFLRNKEERRNPIPLHVLACNKKSTSATKARTKRCRNKGDHTSGIELHAMNRLWHVSNPADPASGCLRVSCRFLPFIRGLCGPWRDLGLCGPWRDLTGPDVACWKDLHGSMLPNTALYKISVLVHPLISVFACPSFAGNWKIRGSLSETIETFKKHTSKPFVETYRP